MLHHGRDVHPTWVKSFTETLSNKGSGFSVQGQSPKRTLTVTNEKWLTAYAIRGLRVNNLETRGARDMRVGKGF